jgi:hypothetical protein
MKNQLIPLLGREPLSAKGDIDHRVSLLALFPEPPDPFPPNGTWEAFLFTLEVYRWRLVEQCFENEKENVQWIKDRLAQFQGLCERKKEIERWIKEAWKVLKTPERCDEVEGLLLDAAIEALEEINSKGNRTRQFLESQERAHKTESWKCEEKKVRATGTTTVHDARLLSRQREPVSFILLAFLQSSESFTGKENYVT